MSRRKLLQWTVAAALLLGLIGATGYLHSFRAFAAFNRHSLAGASQAEVGQYAIDYTGAEFHILSGSPQVVLVRPVKVSDFPSLGFRGTMRFANGEPPLVLAVLHGDFDVTNLAPGRDSTKWHSRVAYIAYIFDVNSGEAAMTASSWRGGDFRRLLGDPSLPADDPVVTAVSDSVAPHAVPYIPPTPRATIPARPYGSIAPTVVPPP